MNRDRSPEYPPDDVAVSKLPLAIRGVKKVVLQQTAILYLDVENKPCLIPHLFYSWSGIQQKWLPAVASHSNELVAYSTDDKFLTFMGVVYHPEITALDVGKKVYLSRKNPGQITFDATQDFVGKAVAENRLLLHLNGINCG